MIIVFNDKNQIFWLIHILIKNLCAKIQYFQKQSKTFLLIFIFIIHDYPKDTKNKDKNLKIKIYYIAFQIILQ